MATAAVDRVVLLVLKQTVRPPGLQMEQTKRTSADGEFNEPHFGRSRHIVSFKAHL